MIVAHPAISADGTTLYFASNIPGGFGGLDIWKVTRATPG
jgi:peptidoglycan-associated lipoprotein